MSGSLHQRNVLITGGTSGIGRACAVLFARAGARVAVTYRSNPDAARELGAQLEGEGADFLAIRSDASQQGDVAQAVEAASVWGPVDVLVNNVGGVIRRSPGIELDPVLWREILALNLDSTYLFSRGVLPPMLERGSGAIVNISAFAARNGGAGNGSIAYGVAKAGIEAMTVGLARDLAGTGVRINAVQVGLVDTPLHLNTEFDATYGRKEDFFSRVSKATPMGRAANPEEIAECVVFLASDRSSYVTGAVLQATGGL